MSVEYYAKLERGSLGGVSASVLDAIARALQLDEAERAHRFYPDWDLAADTTVANLRTEAGQDPHNKSLHDLIGELSTRSDESAAAGAPTTFAPTAPVSNTSTTTSSAASAWPTKASTSEPNPASL